MKFLIASDIHGSSYYCEMLLNAFATERADRMLLLGDLLYHGPRNDLPRDYNPKKVIPMLNSIKNKLICVRGNCDSEVDQMVLDFPIMAEYAVMPFGEKLIYVTHGHIFNESNLPPLQNGDILLHGHTHVPKCTVHENYIYLNPGSVSIPKEGSAHSFAVLDGNKISWRNLENGEEYMSKNL